MWVCDYLLDQIEYDGNKIKVYNKAKLLHDYFFK